MAMPYACRQLIVELMMNGQQRNSRRWFVEKFKFSVGSFLPVSNTNIQVGIKGGAAWCGHFQNETNGEGHFKWGYNGPSLAVTYSFGKKPWK